VRVPKAPPRAWHADPWVNRHVGILIGQDRYEVLPRLIIPPPSILDTVEELARSQAGIGDSPSES
jgi:hypothetical protein